MPEEVTNETVMKKMTEVGDRLELFQKKATELDEKYNGLDAANIQEQIKKVPELLNDIQELKQLLSAEDFKERMDAIELELARGGGSGETEEELFQKAYMDEMLGYLRKGKPLTEESALSIMKRHVDRELLGATDAEKELHLQANYKDLISGIGPEGGYFVLPERSTSISMRIFETSPLRPVANVVSTGSNEFEIPLDDDEPAAGWVGEVPTSTRVDTGSADIALIKIPVMEIFAQPRATQRMLDDAGFDLEAWHNNKVARKFGRIENTAFVSGDGSLKPRGFLTYDAWSSAGVYQRDAVERITATGTAGTVDEADDLISLQNSLLEEYQAAAVWGMKRATFGAIMKLKDSQGKYLMDPTIIKDGTDKFLLGKAVIFMSDMPTVAAAAVPIIYANFGDFYTIVDRFGIRVLRDPYTAKPFVRFYTTKRVGGAVSNYEAGKILLINS